MYELKELKDLRKKIYIKQKNILNHIYDNNLNFNDDSIKQTINEINLLEFVYDSKKDLYNNQKKEYKLYKI